MPKPLDKKILEFIKIKKTVTLVQLCKEFYMSESSGRRALSRLDELGLIQRYRGGANSVEKVHNHMDIHKRFDDNASLKEKIAIQASRMIKPHSTAVLLGGTTVFRMCKHIKNIPVTIITNSIIVFNELTGYENIQLILLGGEYNQHEAELRGFLTLSNSKLVTCDHLFMGADGLIKNVGFTTLDWDAIELYSWCMALSRSTNILIDSTKFHKRGKAVIAPLGNINCVVTDTGAPEEIVKNLEHHSIKVIIPE